MYTSSVFRFNMFKSQIHQTPLKVLKVIILKVKNSFPFPQCKIQLLQCLAYKHLNIALTME